jgi:hypothetical protein
MAVSKMSCVTVAGLSRVMIWPVSICWSEEVTNLSVSHRNGNGKPACT